MVNVIRKHAESVQQGRAGPLTAYTLEPQQTKEGLQTKHSSGGHADGVQHYLQEH